MSKRGNKPLDKIEHMTEGKIRCLCCDKEILAKNLYTSDSQFYAGTGRLPYCKSCIDKLYDSYRLFYISQRCANPECKAMERLCMAFGVYYNDKILDAAIKQCGTSIPQFYFKQAKLYQYRKNNYDTTIGERNNMTFDCRVLPDSTEIVFCDRFRMPVNGGGEVRLKMTLEKYQ